MNSCIDLAVEKLIEEGSFGYEKEWLEDYFIQNIKPLLNCVYICQDHGQEDLSFLASKSLCLFYRGVRKTDQKHKYFYLVFNSFYNAFWILVSLWSFGKKLRNTLLQQVILVLVLCSA